MNEVEQRTIFSKNLNRYLELHNLTQAEVAKRIGVSAQTFNTWCKGIALPRMGKIQSLADFFKINKSDLIDPASSSSSERALTCSEEALIDKYRELNGEGQEKVLDYATDLVAGGRYIKSDPDKVVDAEA